METVENSLHEIDSIDEEMSINHDDIACSEHGMDDDQNQGNPYKKNLL
jgi:hypothetical protein